MSKNPRTPDGFSDDQLESLLATHFSNRSEELIERLDQRIESYIGEASQDAIEIEYQDPRTSRSLFPRLAVSYALIAAMFFAMGMFVNQIQTQSPVATSNEIGDEYAAPEFRVPNYSQSWADQEPIEFRAFAFEDAIRVEGPTSVAPEILVRNFVEGDSGLPPPSLSSVPDEDQSTAAGDEADAEAGVVPMEAAAPQTEDKETRNAVPNIIYPQIWNDGYLYSLTENGLIRIPVQGLQVLTENLQAPQYWSFDTEGNLLIVDKTTEGFVLYQLKRVEQ